MNRTDGRGLPPEASAPPVSGAWPGANHAARRVSQVTYHSHPLGVLMYEPEHPYVSEPGEVTR